MITSPSTAYFIPYTIILTFSTLNICLVYVSPCNAMSNITFYFSLKKSTQHNDSLPLSLCCSSSLCSLSIQIQVLGMLHLNPFKPSRPLLFKFSCTELKDIIMATERDTQWQMHTANSQLPVTVCEEDKLIKPQGHIDPTIS